MNLSPRGIWAQCPALFERGSRGRDLGWLNFSNGVFRATCPAIQFWRAPFGIIRDEVSRFVA